MMKDNQSSQIEKTAVTPKTPRRHDLDALRAVAMLLGIVLHAALPYLRGDAGAILSPIVDVIHGFRMPLFFLLSGFFTAMLWRRRGLSQVVWHRFRRILLPLIVFTPIVLLLLSGVESVGNLLPTDNGIASLEGEDDQSPLVQGKVWELVYDNDVDGLEELKVAFPNLTFDVELGDSDWRPLHLAAVLNHAEIVMWLVDNGADPTAQTIEGWTALDFAVANGHTQVATTLRDNGAEIGDGDPEFIPTTESVIAFNEGEGFDFAHLWFLWFLWWLVIGFAGIALILERVQLPPVPSRWVVTPLRFIWLFPLTLIYQLPQMWSGSFGPETFTGIFIPVHLLFYYATFFGFGALYYHYRDDVVDAGRGWQITLPVCLFVLYPLTNNLMQSSDGWGWTLLLAAMLMTVYTWVMIFASIGLFRALFSNESKVMRYVSDSSYFLYIFHLPLISLISELFSLWQAPDLLQFVVVIVVATVILLIVYEVAVRYTFVGRFLNGRRERPSKPNSGAPIESVIRSHKVS